MDPETQRRIEKRVRKLDSSVVAPRTCSVCQAQIEVLGSTRAGSKKPGAAQKQGPDGMLRCPEHAQRTHH